MFIANSYSQPISFSAYSLDSGSFRGLVLLRVISLEYQVNGRLPNIDIKKMEIYSEIKSEELKIIFEIKTEKVLILSRKANI